MAVVAQGQRLRQAAGQRLEAAEMADPLGIAQPVQPHLRGGAIIAEAQDRLREGGRRHRIIEIRAKRGDGGFGCEGGHGGMLWPQRGDYSTR